MLAALTNGAVRAYKLPLGDVFQELRCSSQAVTQLALSGDHFQLFAGTASGTVFVFDLKDRDPSRTAAAAERREEALAWSNEVLIAKSSLEEKQQRIAELESQVAMMDDALSAGPQRIIDSN